VSAPVSAEAAALTAAGNRRGIAIMVVAMVVFAVQDGVSKHLATHYSPIFVTMVRYWFFALFVVALSTRQPGGLRAAASTRLPMLQMARGALLALEIVVMITAFAMIGLVESHAIFAGYTLIVTALSGPILGERVGWRRWVAIAVGLAGVLIILRPGMGLFEPGALIALLSMLMFAGYHLATRYANRVDGSAVSFFYTGVGGAVTMTLIGPFFWTPMQGWDWAWMGSLCVTGMLGHWLLIRALDAAEASAVQPFAYLQLVFASAIGVAVFAERLAPAVVVGATLVVGAGLFTFWRERRSSRREAR
jgi:drug/metabolite transporter (DMT)-like permease